MTLAFCATTAHKPIAPVSWNTSKGEVVLLDQTLIPQQVVYRTVATVETMVEAISTMVVRGAPAIGIAGAFGVVLAAQSALQRGLEGSVFQEAVVQQALALRESRPTAVNLMWAIDRMLATLYKLIIRHTPQKEICDSLLVEAQLILDEDIAMNRAMGKHGAALLPENARIVTHCNAGALATGGFGTALGVVREAFAQGRCAMVYADETRPRQQGGKLTVWELQEDGIPVTLITDGMSGALMRTLKAQGSGVDAVIVGADRIALNGDTANKIGTYNLALVAKAHGVPFYIAAPSTTFDTSLANGEGIPIEERCGTEIVGVGDSAIAAEHTVVWNPGFDVTPADLISGFITESGVFQASQLPQWLAQQPVSLT
jgi:methylthioribose-1-phosphate isomerase